VVHISENNSISIRVLMLSRAAQISCFSSWKACEHCVNSTLTKPHVHNHKFGSEGHVGQAQTYLKLGGIGHSYIMKLTTILMCQSEECVGLYSHSSHVRGTKSHNGSWQLPVKSAA